MPSEQLPFDMSLKVEQGDGERNWEVQSSGYKGDSADRTADAATMGTEIVAKKPRVVDC